MSLADEIETETWHILVTIYTYKRMIEDLSTASTRYELANHMIALNALAEMAVIRTARLADKRKDARSVSMLLKRSNFGPRTQAVTSKAEIFLTRMEPVLKIRHEQVAHMKPGTLSSYPIDPLPREVIFATEALVGLIDALQDNEASFIYRVGSQEAPVDLRASLIAGSRITT